jgi:hypothetical protein
MLNFHSDSIGLDFDEWNEEVLHYLTPQVRANIKTNKSMRAGFVALFEHFATCIKDQRMPSQTAILQAVQKSGEWPPVTRNFLERGGRSLQLRLPYSPVSRRRTGWLVMASITNSSRTRSRAFPNAETTMSSDSSAGCAALWGN